MVVVAAEVVVVVDVAVSDVSGEEGAEVVVVEVVVVVVVDVVVEVVLVLLVMVATGAGGRLCASATLPNGADVLVAVSNGTAAVVSAIVSGVDVDVPDSLSLPEEHDAASKAAASATAM